ncbi:hypothetical protein H5410_047056 [Solanum commersonii]|uniref:Uncharacterized protein n=1 Tax=Solanum commersonii TaxID=4109 RepID=A0A9J5XHJ4_SOLCO|nr:hypothetical protein H5410_047056 [Solanum commersonii]
MTIPAGQLMPIRTYLDEKLGGGVVANFKRRNPRRLTLFVKLKSSQSSVVTTSNSRSTPVPSVVTEIQDMRVVVVENQAISTGLTLPQPT